MFSRFHIHITQQNYFTTNDRLLIAVSGGLDSMVLLHLMQRLKYTIGVAHFDHLTRSGESTKDMEFVKNYCAQHNIKFHSRAMDKSVNYKNFQAEAHKQRYAFFNKLGYTKIVTGHHKDDNVESIILNILKGKSVTGITDNYLNIKRPLLAFTKEEIEDYAKENNVSFVNDSSNLESEYDRNYIRNKVIPIINENFENANSKIINLSQRLLKRDEAFLKLSETYLKPKTNNNYTSISKTLIKELGENSVNVLTQYLLKFNFNSTQAKDLVGSLNTIGKNFISDTHKAVIDRQEIRIYQKSEGLTTIEIKLDEIPITIDNYGDYKIKIEKTSKYESQIVQNEAQIDLSKIKNSIQIRSWNEGDIFYPLNMKGHKQSLKKFFANQKIDRIHKSMIPIFTTFENEILWIGGYRLDDRFKVEEDTCSILKITLLPK